MNKKRISRDEALAKLQQYCAYQDRCHQEVRGKLLDLGVYGDDLENVMAELIADGFLNEERFARSYARGKFRLKQWGRLRIVRELKLRDISDYCRRRALEEIDDEEYLDTLRELVEKKAAGLDGEEPFVKRNKVAQHVIRRGFEPDLVWEVVQEVVGDGA